MNSLYKEKYRWKIFLFLGAIAIGGATLWYTNVFVNELREEERKKVALWAKASIQLANIEDTNSDIGFVFDVIKDNTTVPVILTDKEGNINGHRNLDPNKVSDEEYLKKQINIMGQQHDPIQIELYAGNKNYIYYKDSILLTKLQYYPIIMLLVIAAFIFVAYLVFSTSRKAEQNRVWAGMAKETAHQIGTPLSSLMGWVEILKTHNLEKETIEEIEKDVTRLHTIADRFSKIGSKTKNKTEELSPIIENVVSYLSKRISSKVVINNNPNPEKIVIKINKSLFEWVLENIIKNAVDAIGQEGEINISLQKTGKRVNIDVSDTGKGINKSDFKTIFKPGYTSKARGWGLGLSLANRIVSEYHKGEIKVLQSEINKGTTIRVSLYL